MHSVCSLTLMLISTEDFSLGLHSDHQEFLQLRRSLRYRRERRPSLAASPHLSPSLRPSLPAALVSDFLLEPPPSAKSELKSIPVPQSIPAVPDDVPTTAANDAKRGARWTLHAKTLLAMLKDVDSRDKMSKIVQYTLRLFITLLRFCDERLSRPTPNWVQLTLLQALVATLSSARRVMRLFKFTYALPALSESFQRLISCGNEQKSRPDRLRSTLRSLLLTCSNLFSIGSDCMDDVLFAMSIAQITTVFGRSDAEIRYFGCWCWVISSWFDSAFSLGSAFQSYRRLRLAHLRLRAIHPTLERVLRTKLFAEQTSAQELFLQRSLNAVKFVSDALSSAITMSQILSQRAVAAEKLLQLATTADKKLLQPAASSGEPISVYLKEMALCCTALISALAGVQKNWLTLRPTGG